MTDKLGPPPQPFKDFSALFPGIAKAWQTLSSSGSAGPLDDKTQRLIKLGIVIGSRSEGSTHSATRKALSAGASPEEIYQVIALAASNIGLPSAVAAFTWVQDVVKKT